MDRTEPDSRRMVARQPATGVDAVDSSMAEPGQVFVYGTLLPGQARWRYLERWVSGPGVRTSAAADLYDTGLGYPAAVFSQDPNYRGGITHGMRFGLRPSASEEALSNLDEVEGAVLGLYHRVAIKTADDVVAWAYTVGTELELTPVPGGDWLAAQQCDDASRE